MAFWNHPDWLVHQLTLVVMGAQWKPHWDVQEQGTRWRHTADAENTFLREEISQN